MEFNTIMDIENATSTEAMKAAAANAAADTIMDIENIISIASMKAAVAIVLTRGVETRVRLGDLVANLKSCITDRWDEMMDDCAGMSDTGASESQLRAYLTIKAASIATAAVNMTAGGER